MPHPPGDHPERALSSRSGARARAVRRIASPPAYGRSRRSPRRPSRRSRSSSRAMAAQCLEQLSGWFGSKRAPTALARSARDPTLTRAVAALKCDGVKCATTALAGPNNRIGGGSSGGPSMGALTWTSGVWPRPVLRARQSRTRASQEFRPQRYDSSVRPGMAVVGSAGTGPLEPIHVFAEHAGHVTV
jgi:hypothetical protein